MTTRAIPNPVIPGFAPDPSVTRIKDFYILATSSFHVFPGIPIYASNDLSSWKHIGNAINRPSQLSLALASTPMKLQDDGEVALATGGLYAPTIRHHNGTTYVICTNFIHEGPENYRLENFIVSTKDVWSDEWSDPVYFDWFGIDPDLFWDDDGRVYVMGSAWKENPRAYISCMEIDIDTGATLSPEVEVWDGFTKVIPEGPHLIKKDGYYYLLVSEGGTSENHCLTMARSRSIWGPYESCESNPVLQPANERGMAVQHTGHGDIFLDSNGQWWAACLGVRKSEDRYHMGRESFLTKARWEPGEWPVVDPVEIDPRLTSQPPEIGKPLVDLVYLRNPDLKRYSVAASIEGLSIDMQPSQTDLSESQLSVSFIGKRQRLLQGNASVKLLLDGEHSKLAIKSGLALFKDEHRFARIYWDPDVTAVRTQLLNGAKSIRSIEQFSIEPSVQELVLRLEYSADSFRWYYRCDAKNEVCAGTCSTLDLTGHDFIGPLIGVFAVSEQQEESEACFREFQVDIAQRNQL